MKISIIVALDLNNGIGSGNRLPWHLPDDFKWFKRQTMGKPLIMGRNTMNSLGKALPGRQNIVISSSPNHIIEGFSHTPSIEEALAEVPAGTEEVMVIGGGIVFGQMLNSSDKMYITRIDHAFDNMDTFFPAWNESEWEITFREKHPSDEKHLYPFEFIVYERKEH